MMVLAARWSWQVGSANCSSGIVDPTEEPRVAAQRAHIRHDSAFPNERLVSFIPRESRCAGDLPSIVEENGRPIHAAERAPELADEFETNGVEHWARRTMAGRLGSDFPQEGVEWWIKFMGRTAVSTQIGFMKTIACADIRADVPQIRCPTLVITTDGSGLASVDQTRAWQQQIPHSSLLVLPGNSYHVAASHAARCSEATLDFIEHHPGAA